MDSKGTILIFLGLNVVLLVCNVYMASALREFGYRETQQLESLRTTSGALAANRARFDASNATLSRAIKELKEVNRVSLREMMRAREEKGSGATPPEPVNEEGEEGEEEQSSPGISDEGYQTFLRNLENMGLGDRPDPASIPLMSELEKQELAAKIAALPKLDDRYLEGRDLYGLVRDPLWNPTGRKLSEEEQSELKRLINDYTYYTDFAHTERFWQYVHPEITGLREIGAFVEYQRGEPPPALEGMVCSHAEPSDREGFLRIYYFPADDYPEIQHHKQVEIQETRRTYAAVYELINRGN